MNTQSSTQGGKSNAPSQQDADKDGTFTTDVSETDDEGTTVREAEVRESDLQEKNPPDQSGS